MRPKLEKDAKRIQNEIITAKNVNWNLYGKLRIISSCVRAEPLGLCGLEPGKEYPIIKMERVNRRIVIVHYFSELYSNRTVPYPLPERYGDMVSEAYNEKINSGKIKYNLVRSVKNVDLIDIDPTIKITHGTWNWCGARSLGRRT